MPNTTVQIGMFNIKLDNPSPSAVWYIVGFQLILVSVTVVLSFTVVRPILDQIFTTPQTSPSTAKMTSTWSQKTLTLPSQARGAYLITDIIESQLPELKQYRIGILHLFMQHTSAALSLNENWDADVRADMSDTLDRIVPNDSGYRHSCEGPDDMPAHVKSALIGASVSVPIADGKLALGTWQGVWYLEFRAAKHTRKVVATIQGEKRE
jgi:secondary thiamine-phosphate synthase enzyme